MQDIHLQELIALSGPLPDEKIQTISSVAGGCIHQAWRIELQNGKQLFAKTSPPEAFPILECEANGLTALTQFANESSLIIPKPLAISRLKSNAVLLLPWLNLKNGDQKNLGKGLALLHKKSSESNPKKFGWETRSFIGRGIQKRGWDVNWGKCFVNLRLIPQLEHASKWGLKPIHYQKLVLEIIPFLNQHDPIPSLVHGDLWSGNSGIQEDDKGVIFDPASWWADREVDIAMTKLFGGFSHTFYKAYKEIWDLPEDNSTRTSIYNLYHLLNHANMFGGGYINQCFSLIKSLNREMIN